METKIALSQIERKYQDLFRVILLEPKESLNIGSVARAMMNMGFRDLVIVSPLNFDLERAATTARKARVLVDSAEVLSTLGQALAPCTYVAGSAFFRIIIYPSTRIRFNNTWAVTISSKWIVNKYSANQYS